MKTPTNRPLTRKQREFVKELVTNPKATKVSAYKKAYNVAPTTKIESVYREAIATSQKPQVISALTNYNELVENTLTNTVKHFADSDKVAERSLAVDTAKYIHDKIHGKATQRIEQQTTGVTLTIDLTSALAIEPSLDQ